jgi:hypothetical protein
MIDLDAIRKRNEALRRVIEEEHYAGCDCDDCEVAKRVPADIDALLAEVERLRAYTPNPLASPVWPDPEESGP